jgi:hypothetical protein
MQYWKKPNNGRVQRVEDIELKKHPEKLFDLENQGYERIMDEDDFSPYKKSFVKKTIKKLKKK